MTHTVYKIAFMSLKCLDETSDGGASDEPYVVMFVADVSQPVPRARAFRTSVFGGVDEGEKHSQWVRIWGLDRKPAVIPDPDELIVLVTLMEHDYSYPDLVLASVQGMTYANLVALRSAGVDRQTLVNELKTTVQAAIRLGRATALNKDDIVGVTHELRFTSKDLELARRGLVTKDIEVSGDDGRYRLEFHMRAGPD